MTGEVEAIADVATGALIARAIDGGAGASLGGRQCLNCGTALVGAHCHACGQAAHVHRSLGAIWHDLAHGVFHFEGKIWRTLPLLAIRPGELTRRYVQGERARFLSPLALFLFSMFLMFAVISLLGIGMPGDAASPQARAVSGRELAEQQRIITAEIVKAEAERRAATPAQASELDARLKVLRNVRMGLSGQAVVEQFDRDDFTTGWPRLDEGIKKARANPNLLVYKLQSSAYKFSWALIPLSVPFVALLFVWRRQYRLYDHAVFVTYSLSFMSLLVIVLSIAGALAVPEGLISAIAVFAPPLHMYKQLRGAYRLGRFSTGWRLVFLMTFAFWVLLFFLLMLIGWGILG